VLSDGSTYETLSPNGIGKHICLWRVPRKRWMSHTRAVPLWGHAYLRWLSWTAISRLVQFSWTETEGFWWSCTALRITGLWALSIVWNSKYKKKQRFGNGTCFRPQVRGGRHPLCWVPYKELTSITAYSTFSWTHPGISCLYSCCYVTWVVHWLRLALSKGPNRDGVFLLLTWGWKQIQNLERCVF
jgi:hypothetical protein